MTALAGAFSALARFCRAGPAAATLTHSKFGQVLAPSVGAEQLAGIEPMLGDRALENQRRRPRELGVVRATKAPEPPSIGHVREDHHFFDPAVAVRGDDQDAAGESRGIGDAEDQVVVEFTLRPMLEQLVASELGSQLFEQRAENELGGKDVNDAHEENTIAWKVWRRKGACCDLRTSSSKPERSLGLVNLPNMPTNADAIRAALDHTVPGDSVRYARRMPYASFRKTQRNELLEPVRTGSRRAQCRPMLRAGSRRKLARAVRLRQLASRPSGCVCR